MSAWDTEFGRYIFDRAAYYRRLNAQPLPGEEWRPVAEGELPPAPPETADEAFAREIELAREVCEDAEVDALTQPVPTVTLPFGGEEK